MKTKQTPAFDATTVMPNSDRKDALIAKGAVALEVGDVAAALDLLGEAYGLEPSDLRLAVRYGDLLVETDRFSEAIAVARRSLTHEPASAGASLVLARALQATARHDEAVTILRKVAAANPTASNLIYLGDAEATLGNAEYAKRAFRAAIELEPDNEEALFNLGLELRRDAPDEARELLERAVALDPAYSAALTELGHSYWAAGRLEDAESVLRHSRDIDPAQPWASLYSALVARDQGRTADAEKHLMEASAASPMWAAPQWLLGVLLDRANRTTEARVHFDRATSLEPDDPSGAYLFAEFHLATGDIASAERWAGITLALDPSHRRALHLSRQLADRKNRPQT